jgi:hypothetical protein
MSCGGLVVKLSLELGWAEKKYRGKGFWGREARERKGRD